MKSGTIDTLNLKHIGLLELLYASYPITSGYLLGRIPMTVLMLVIMDIVALFRNKEKLKYKPILYLGLCHTPTLVQCFSSQPSETL